MKKENLLFIKKLNYKYRIGMRALKTALAVVIGLYVSNFLNLNSPIFVSIAAISTMKPSLSESLSDTKKRLFTSVFGVLLGYLSSKLSLPHIFEPLIAGLGILLIIYILVFLDMKDMTQLSCIVFVASFAAESKLLYAINRILGTFVGIVVGVLVNYVISSPNVYKDFLESIKKTYRSSNRILISLVVENSSDLSEFNNDYKTTITLYNLLKKEAKTPFHHDLSIEKEKKMMSLLDSISVRLEVINNMEIENLNPIVVDELHKRYNLSRTSNFKDLSETDRVTNYHIESILKYLDELKELIGEKE